MFIERINRENSMRIVVGRNVYLVEL